MYSDNFRSSAIASRFRSTNRRSDIHIFTGSAFFIFSHRCPSKRNPTRLERVGLDHGTQPRTALRPHPVGGEAAPPAGRNEYA